MRVDDWIPEHVKAIVPQAYEGDLVEHYTSVHKLLLVLTLSRTQLNITFYNNRTMPGWYVCMYLSIYLPPQVQHGRHTHQT